MATLVYVFFIMLALWYAVRYDHVENDDPYKNHRYWLLCILLICISGLSYGLGGDKFSYMEFFEAIPNDVSLFDYVYYAILLQGNMPLWSVLMFVVKRTTDSFFVLQFVQAIIVNVTIFYFARRYTKRYFIFVLLYFSWWYFLFNTEVMREGIAIACSMFAIESWFRGSKKRFAFFLLLALMFHVSALTLLAFPFMRLKVKPILLPIAFGTAVLGWLISDLLFGKLFVMALGGIGALAQKAMNYTAQASTVFGFLRSAITYVVLPFIVMYFSVKWEQDEERKRRKEKMMVFHLFLSVLASSFVGAVRLRNYVDLFYVFMLADFIFMLLKTKEHFVIRSATLFGTVVLLYLGYFAHYPQNNKYFYQFYVPYTTFLDDDKDVQYRNSLHSESSQHTVSDSNTRDIK